jgi:hypothetical protein
MHRYRVLGVIISVVLTIALSLGFASAAGYLPGPAAGKAPSAAAAPGWAAAPSGDEVAALAALKGKAKGLLLQARGDDDDAGRPEGAGRPEEKGPPPGLAAKQGALGDAGLVDNACSAHATGMTEDGLAERDRYQLRCRGLHAVLLVADAGAACEFCPTETNLADPAGYVAPSRPTGRSSSSTSTARWPTSTSCAAVLTPMTSTTSGVLADLNGRDPRPRGQGRPRRFPARQPSSKATSGRWLARRSS